MASHRRAKESGPGRIFALTAAAAAAAALAAHGSAFADPAQPRGASAQEVNDQVGTLYNEAESAGQRFDGALAQQQELQRRAGAVQQRLAEEQQRLNDALESVAALAGAEYREGDLPQTLRLMLDSRPAEYLDRAADLGQADIRTAQEVQQIHDQERRLAQDRAEAEGELQQIAELRGTLTSAKAQVQRRLAAARSLLATLSAAQRAQLRAAQQQAAQAAAAEAGLGPLGASGLLGGQGLPGGGQAPADARAATAVAAAERALGMPYVYGATGPAAFDCSGLMYWAWQQAGVTLPRTSQGQAFAGTRIPLSQARPGDLVIYYGDMHHVGMYVGNNTIIHAPYPGATVRFERATDMPVAAVVRV